MEATLTAAFVLFLIMLGADVLEFIGFSRTFILYVSAISSFLTDWLAYDRAFPSASHHGYNPALMVVMLVIAAYCAWCLQEILQKYLVYLHFRLTFVQLMLRLKYTPSYGFHDTDKRKTS